MIISGLNKEFSDFPVEEIPLSLIMEPWRYRDSRRIPQYVKMLNQGKNAPPIELIECFTPTGRPLNTPYEIYNGAHRYKAALLAGRKTILAVIVDEWEYEPYHEDEYAD